MKKRTFLELSLKAMGLVTLGLGLIAPGVSFFSPLLRKPKKPLWQALGNVTDFPLQQTLLVKVAHHTGASAGVYVRRVSDLEFVVFSRSCTDLGCPVNWDPGSHCFFCPCHGGIFTNEGRPIAGPPPRPLYRYKIQIRDGSLEIDLLSVPPMS